MLNRMVLLAHPDDEMLCLPFLIEQGAKDFQQDFFVYLTVNSLPEGRVNESRKAVELLDRPDERPGDAQRLDQRIAVDRQISAAAANVRAPAGFQSSTHRARRPRDHRPQAPAAIGARPAST